MPSSIRSSGMFAWLGTVALTATVWGADEPWIREWLARPILAADSAEIEVQQYCEARVARLPSVPRREEWDAYASRLRGEILSRVVLRGEAAQWADRPTRVEWLESIEGGAGYRIKKLRFEAVPGMWIPALLYEPLELTGRIPVALNVNGHDGKGKAADYKQIRCINQAKRGMLALNVEWLGMGELNGPGYNHSRMNQLDLCGTSGLAPFYLCLKRGLDVALAHPHADPARVVVSGLSGGGWQTIFISSLDTRVTLANPVAGYSSYLTRIHHHSDLGDSEQTPTDLASVADYLHLTALMAPRPTLLTYNAKDNCCFASGHALDPLVEAALPVFRLYGKEGNLRSHVNHDPGTHNFELDNRQAHYRMLAEHFFPGNKDVPLTEIDCQGELKTAERLNIDIPAGNADFQTLARQLAASLPRSPAPPAAPHEAETWRAGKRRELSGVLQAKEYECAAEQVDSAEVQQVEIVRWRLKLGGAWTVPAVEFIPRGAKDVTVAMADGGRQETADIVAEHLRQGRRVVALDPFYIGEAGWKDRPYLFALLVSSVGDRPLGLQASQLAAAARWLRTRQADAGIQLVAQGERLSLAALAASALEPRAIDAVELRGGLRSLKDVIEKNYSVDRMPELFCFGLLEGFDIDRLEALVAPRTVRHVAGP